MQDVGYFADVGFCLPRSALVRLARVLDTAPTANVAGAWVKHCSIATVFSLGPELMRPEYESEDFVNLKDDVPEIPTESRRWGKDKNDQQTLLMQVTWYMVLYAAQHIDADWHCRLEMDSVFVVENLLRCIQKHRLRPDDSYFLGRVYFFWMQDVGYFADVGFCLPRSALVRLARVLDTAPTANVAGAWVKHCSIATVFSWGPELMRPEYESEDFVNLKDDVPEIPTESRRWGKDKNDQQTLLMQVTWYMVLYAAQHIDADWHCRLEMDSVFVVENLLRCIQKHRLHPDDSYFLGRVYFFWMQDVGYFADVGFCPPRSALVRLARVLDTAPTANVAGAWRTTFQRSQQSRGDGAKIRMTSRPC